MLIASRPLAPGAIASIFACVNCSGTQFGTTNNDFNGTYPMATQLGGVEVLVNGIASPLYHAYPNKIDFVVPIETPSSGYADVQVVQVATGQVLGAAQMPMNSVAPGAFIESIGPTVNKVTTYYAAAINQDGTVNSATNPESRGNIISLYMTGQGLIPGGPADGVPATTAISAQYGVTVFLNYVDVNSATYQESSIQHIQYSGLNAYPGMWQVNVQIPKTVVPANGAVSLTVAVNGESNWDVPAGFQTYIFVK
jgi:uncharacterized protein (TIGR03437 family)